MGIMKKNCEAFLFLFLEKSPHSNDIYLLSKKKYKHSNNPSNQGV
jgi:hypothetical protein